MYELKILSFYILAYLRKRTSEYNESVKLDLSHVYTVVNFHFAKLKAFAESSFVKNSDFWPFSTFKFARLASLMTHIILEFL